MHNQFVSKGNGASLNLEEQCTDLLQLSSLPKFEEFIKDKMVSEKIADLDVTPSFSKIVEWFLAHAKLVGDNFQVLSRFMDDHIALASQALQTAKDEFCNVLELNESLRLNVATLEADKQTREAKISSMKKDLMLLLSTCSDATNELEIEFHDAGLDSDSEQHKWSSSLELISKDVSGGETEEGSAGEYAKVAESLLLAVRKVGIGFHQLVNAKRILMTSIDDLEHKFKQEELTAKSAIKDRHQCEERISELEGDLAELRNVCSELTLQIKEFQAKEDMLKDKESKLLTMQSTLTTKERGIGEKFFSEDQVEILIDKVNKMVIPFKELQATGQEVHFSSPVEKLYYVLDEVWELQHTIDSITKDKDDMQLIIVSHAHEIEYLKKVIETMRTNHQDLESKKTEFTELTLGLEKIIQMLGGNESVEDKKTVSAKGLLLSLLERLTMGLSIECENSKSRIQELGAKLQIKEKMVNDLSTKVKSLEESFQPRLLYPPESVKERTLFEPSSATGLSEISEIEVSHCQVMAVQQQKIWEKLENYFSEPVTVIILHILALISILIALYFLDSLLYMSVFFLISMFFMALHFVNIIKGYPDGQVRNQGKVSEGFNSPGTGESPKYVKQLEKEDPSFHRSTLPENTPLIRRTRRHTSFNICIKKNN